MDGLAKVRALARRVAPRDRMLLAWLAAYVTLGVLPLVHRRELVASLAFALLVPPPAALALGLWLQKTRASSAAAYVLLGALPVLLVLPACALRHELALTTFSGLGLGFALCAFAGYVAAAAALCSDSEQRYPSEHRPLGRAARAELPPRKKLGDRVLVATSLAVSVSAVIGASGTPVGFRNHFREAAPAGAALTGVCAGVVATLAIVLLGPYLRAARPSDPREQSRTLRLLPAVLWIASGAAVYVLSRP